MSVYGNVLKKIRRGRSDFFHKLCKMSSLFKKKKPLGWADTLRVGRVTINRHIFYFGLSNGTNGNTIIFFHH